MSPKANASPGSSSKLSEEEKAERRAARREMVRRANEGRERLDRMDDLD